jgi:hypothetical protein
MAKNHVQTVPCTSRSLFFGAGAALRSSHNVVVYDRNPRDTHSSSNMAELPKECTLEPPSSRRFCSCHLVQRPCARLLTQHLLEFLVVNHPVAVAICFLNELVSRL